MEAKLIPDRDLDDWPKAFVSDQFFFVHQKGLEPYAIDVRSVVNPKSRALVHGARPRNLTVLLPLSGALYRAVQQG